MNVSFAELWRCYRACRRTKRTTFNALAFEIDAEAKLLELQHDLREHTYQPGRSICFITEGAKPREVFAADFRDRIVHHVLVGRQEPRFERLFIHDSYACRTGKGTLAASDRLMRQLRQATANGRRPAFALKLDVASYFASIDKQILYDLIARRIADPEVRWLTRVVLFHDPTTDYRFRSLGRGTAPPGDPRYPVAARKSLFGGDKSRGLPIGNLTSQFWANVYLNELDQFAKRRLGCRHYVRYVDDVVLLSASPAGLRAWRAEITVFLRDVLQLALRSDLSEPMPVGRGIDFVGWKTWSSHRVVRRLTLATLDARLRRFARRHVHSAFAGQAWRVDVAPAPLAGLRVLLASYAAHLRHGAAWCDWQRAWAGRIWMDPLLARRGWQVSPRLVAARGRGLVAAYAALLRTAPARCLLFLPRGRFIEFYGPQRLLAERVLGLRRAALGRGGWAFGAGFHRRWTVCFVRRALARGHAVVLFRSASVAGLLAPRPCAILIPAR